MTTALSTSKPIAEASVYTGLSERTLYRYVKAGKLPVYKLGDHRIAFLVEDLDALLVRAS